MDKILEIIFFKIIILKIMIRFWVLGFLKRWIEKQVKKDKFNMEKKPFFFLKNKFSVIKK